jgi:hypothetical protein
MAWQQRLIEKLNSLGYERKALIEGIEFWIEDELLLDSGRGFVRIFRFEEDGLHGTYFSYHLCEGIVHHSDWIIREELNADGSDSYTYHFSATTGPSPHHTNLTYEDLEKKIVEGIEKYYRRPEFLPGELCSICHDAGIECFWTTCDHQLFCFACIEKARECPQCGERGRARRIRKKTIPK